MYPELSYFGLQAYIGTTKHGGGLATTRELIELCHIGRGSYVLEIGSGVGATAITLAKQLECHVMGIDIREPMVARSKERAALEGGSDFLLTLDRKQILAARDGIQEATLELHRYS